MGSPPPISTSCFIKFLKYKKCQEKKGTNHNKWVCPGCFRAIIFDRNTKEIPFLHVHTNLKNIGVNMPDFKKWAAKNC